MCTAIGHIDIVLKLCICHYFYHAETGDDFLQEPSIAEPIHSPTEQQATSDADGELESE